MLEHVNDPLEFPDVTNWLNVPLHVVLEPGVTLVKKDPVTVVLPDVPAIDP